MSGEVFIVLGAVPVMFALLASFFMRDERKDMKVFGIMFKILCLVSCLVAASAVYTNWDSFATGGNMGEPLLLLAGFSFGLGVVFTIITDLIIPVFKAAAEVNSEKNNP